MTKETGLGDQCYIDGVDIGADIQSLSRIGGGVTLLPATNITQSAEARMAGQRDGAMELVSYFNPAAGETHSVISTLPRTDRIVTWGHGTTLGNASASLIGKQINYDPTRAQDGGLLVNIQAQANSYGLTFGQQLT